LQKNQTRPPAKMEIQAPRIDAFFQKSPKVNGANRQTISKTDDATTKPWMLVLLNARKQQIKATTITLILV
jgi:hypothetical protein